MKKSIPFFLALTLLCAGSMQAQLASSWEYSLNGALQWQKVSSSGNYLVATDQSLSGVDQASGEELWSNNSLAGYAETEITEMQGSPLFVAQKENRIRIFNPFSGEVLFDTESAGVANLETRKFLPKSNGLFVSGTAGDESSKMLMVDIASGKTRWEINEDFGRIISVNELNEKSMIITTLFTVYRLNSANGEIEWKAATSADAEAMQDNPLGAMLQGMAEEMTADMDFVIRYFQDTEKGVFVIAAEKEIPMESQDGKTTYTYKNTYTPFNLETGERMWNQTVELDGKLGDLAFYKDGFIALPDDGKRTKINYYPFSAPEGQWGKKGRGTKIKGGVYNHLTYDNGILLISRSGSDSYLDFLNTATGEMAFDKPVKIEGQVVQTIESAKGLAYLTTAEFNILDITTGETLLDKSVETSPALTKLDGKTFYAYDTKGRTVVKIDIDGATKTELYPDKIKLEGKEDVTGLELYEGAVLLTSDQNVVKMNMDGTIGYQAYHPAPRESGLKRALLYAQAARAAYISAASYMASGVMQAAATEVSEEDAVSGAVAGGLGMAYEEMGNQAGEFAKKSFEQARARFKATSQARDFVVMLTEQDKSNKLAKVSKADGQIEVAVDLGKEKDPKYAIDEVTGRIFVDGGGKIVCYELMQ